MDGTERRYQIVRILTESNVPLSGKALGEKLGVSRQVVVQDIALLRTSGEPIESTNRGYVIQAPSRCTRCIKVRHTLEETEAELNSIVDLGGCVQDVMVNHRTYGRIEVPLNIKSRRDVKAFLAELNSGVSSPLMNVTDGYHFHRISADSEDVLDEIESALRDLGVVAPLTSFEEESF